MNNNDIQGTNFYWLVTIIGILKLKVTSHGLKQKI